MSKIRHITIVGSGLAASYFANTFFRHGCVIDNIISRNSVKGKALSKSVKADYSDDFTQIIYSDLVLVCVKDDAISKVIKDLTLDKGIIAHCAGGIHLDVLSDFDKRAVIYPLQTLVLNAVNTKVPILYESNQSKIEDQIKMLLDVCQLSGIKADSKNRSEYHLAAVFANNFTNAVMNATEDISLKFDLNFELLKPLLSHTIQNVLDGNSASNLQTGPAKRHDSNTMTKHKEMLLSANDLRSLYEAISKYIASKYPTKP